MRPLALLVAVVIGVFVQCAAPPDAKASDVKMPGLVSLERLPARGEHPPGWLPVILRTPALAAQRGRLGDSAPASEPSTLILASDDAHIANTRATPSILPESIICAPSLRWDCGTMLAIAWRESRLDNTAVNPYSGAACWFQIHPIHGYDSRVLTSDPWACTFAAYDLFLESEYKPWRVHE